MDDRTLRMLYLGVCETHNWQISDKGFESFKWQMEAGLRDERGNGGAEEMKKSLTKEFSPLWWAGLIAEMLTITFLIFAPFFILVL